MRAVVRHRLRWPVLVAALALGLGYLAFEAGRADWRVVPAGVAVLAALAYPVAWWRRAQPPPPEAALWLRAARFAVLVLLSVAALGGLVLGVAVVLGRLLEDDIAPLDLTWMYVGLGVLVAVLFSVAAWWATAFQRIVGGWSPRLWFSLPLAGLAVAGGLLWLDDREIPNQRTFEDTELARQAVRGKYDLLLVVDPADPVSRQLIRAARAHVARDQGEELFARPDRNVRYDVAFGIAVPERRHGDDPLWRLVEPPTTDSRELADALARIELREGPLAAPSYGRLLADTLVQERVRWRPEAQRGVAFVLRDLPSLSELAAYEGQEGDAIPIGADPATACTKFLRARATLDPTTNRSVAVSWGEALAAHCRRRALFRQWEADGRQADHPPPLPPVAVHALTRETREDRDAPWFSWVQALDGRFHRPPVKEGGDGLDAEQLLLDARDVHTGVAVGRLGHLAETFRPHLFFDAREEFFPVDVDWLLREGGRHHVCDRRDLDRDNCERLDDPQDLAGSLDEYIDFEGGARLGRDLRGRDAGPTRMYVHALQDGGRLYLGYWWYLPFNSSPWRPEVNCLPGLTLKELSCYDHEGDWEGVTVIFDLEREHVLPDPYDLANATPVAALYDSHGHAIRWAWDEVELAADRDRLYATHPVVYVAAGSHASYPGRCRREECDQRLAGSAVPDGGFDGARPWPYNDRAKCEAQQVGPDGTRLGPCLIGLPSTRDGRLGMMWNAFPGAWGKATCTRIAKVCSQVDGPRSPSLQKRFKAPGKARNGPAALLRRVAAADRRARADGSPRWPPDRP